MAAYTNTPDPHDDIVEALAILFNVAIIAWIIACFTSCAPKTIVVPEYHTEYVTRTDTFCKVDSFYQRDSIAVYLQGDTICRDKYRYLDKYRYIYKTTTDTLIKADSICVPVPIERQLTKWEATQMTIGKYAFYALASLFIAVIVYLTVWWYKNKI